MFELKKELLATHEALLTVTIEPEAEREAYQQALRRIGRKISIPGFRKGRAPRGIVERKFGKEAIWQEAAEELLEKISEDVFEQADIQPYRPGELEDLTLSPITFVLRVPLSPEVELGDYANLRQDPKPVEVTAAELTEALEKMREDNVILEPVARPAQLEDKLEIVTIHGEAAEDIFIDDVDFSLRLSESDDEIAPGFSAALVGVEAGEKKSFTLTMPEDFEEEKWQNREISFEVEVAEVYERTLPELDDALASTIGNFESLVELQENLQAEMLEYKEQEAEQAYTDELIDALVAGAEIHYPPVMVKEELDTMEEQLKERFEGYGMKWETFQNLQSETETDLREGWRPEVELRIQRGLALNKFAQITAVKVSDEEVQAEFQTAMAARGIEDPELLSGFNFDSELGNNIRNALYGNKVLEQLRLLAQGLLDLEAETAEESEIVTEPEAVAPEAE
ncbi:MAG: trigger factor [Anaerolineae bacterium]|nr:trigger factor [Anaerolineae bacterium]